MNRIMKKILFLLFITISLNSCGPEIYYLGDKYDFSNNLQVFYDEDEIEAEYTIIGKMTIDKSRKHNPKKVKEKMIRKAQRYGAEGLIFTDFYVERLQKEKEDCLVINAKLVKFR